MESSNEEYDEDSDEDNTGVAGATDTVGATAAALPTAAPPSGTTWGDGDRPSGTATATPISGTATGDRLSGTATAAPTSGTATGDRPSGTATAAPTSGTAVTMVGDHDGDDTGKED